MEYKAVFVGFMLSSCGNFSLPPSGLLICLISLGVDKGHGRNPKQLCITTEMSCTSRTVCIHLQSKPSGFYDLVSYMGLNSTKTVINLNSVFKNCCIKKLRMDNLLEYYLLNIE